MSCSQPRRAEAALSASCVQELGRRYRHGGRRVRHCGTVQGGVVSEGVGEQGHWYHVVWGYVINLEFASWGGRKERDSCGLGVKIQTRATSRTLHVRGIDSPGIAHVDDIGASVCALCPKPNATVHIRRPATRCRSMYCEMLLQHDTSMDIGMDIMANGRCLEVQHRYETGLQEL